MSNGFPCNGCGACCRRIDLKVFEANGIDFPFEVNNGRCEKLTEDNKCSVYESRPDICNIDKMISITGVDRDTAYIETINVCNNFMEQDGIKNFINI